MSMMQTPGEPPDQDPTGASHRPPGAMLRAPVAAGLIVALLAAFGGAAIAHFAWPSNSSSTSNPTGSIVTPQSNSLAPATTASSGHVSRGLVDVNTITNEGPAAGTGMVVTSNGEVITNNHVINGATQISAYDVGNGQNYTARVIGYDRTQDVAVIQLEGASGLATVPLGDSAALRVGAAVVTIGNAGGVGGTPSAATGTVDGLKRSITASDSEESGNVERLKGVIQINGSLQPGDSGGPLVSGGRVVGMDTAASSDFSFQSQTAGAGFAIPINQVLAIRAKIVAGHGSDLIHIGQTALIGVYISDKTECYNATTGIYGGGSGASGALVCGVVSGTPAAGTALASSGLSPANKYDTITSLGGRAVTSAAALLSLMDTHHPGDRVSVTWVDPSGTSHSATITLTSGPAD
jgi:S1-C subfamily serine protease